MSKVRKLSEEEKLIIKDAYEYDKYSITEAARIIGIERGTLRRKAKELGYEKKSPTIRQGTPFNWTEDKINFLKKEYSLGLKSVIEIANDLNISEDTITKKAKELNIKKVRKSKISEFDYEELKKILENQRISKISKDYSIAEKTLIDFAKKNKIKMYSHSRGNMKELKNTKEFLLDISNPRYNHEDLANKYNVSPSSIGQFRKKIYGEFKSTLNTNERLTSNELEISKILDELDIVYYVHKVIILDNLNKWNVDFYLGNKLIIEFNGIYWHSNEKVIEKDKRKKEELEANNYRILYLNENTQDLKSTIQSWVSSYREVR